MTASSMAGLLRHLRRIADPSGAAGVSDTELLERFVQRRDEAAFELLVWRHQRMVLGVCRRVLGDLHDAEDAFQATFLALARKAAAVGRRQAVAGWLHTVAYRIALRARAARRKKMDVDLAALAAPGDVGDDVARRELASVLDEEVGRLPEKYRIAVVLCYLEGKSYAEAGRQLGLAIGTLAGHLTRARTLLRKRLTRRGIDVSGTVLAALLCEQASSAAAPVALVKAATSLAAVSSPRAASAAVAALAEGTLRSLFLSKLKFAMVVFVAGFLVAGMGVLIPAALAPSSASHESPKSPAAPVADKEKPARVDRYGDPLPTGALFRFGSIQMRHDGTIRASALSPDGKLLATSSGRSVVLWDLAAGKSLRRFVCDKHWPYSFPGIAFSPDGKYLGYVHSNDFARVWDVISGEEVLRLGSDKSNYHRLCRFTPDGKQFILNEEKRVNFWDLRVKRETRSLLTENVSLLSPNARTWVRIEVAGIHFGDVQTGKETKRLSLDTHYDGIENGVAFAPNGEVLAIVHQKKEIQIRDIPGGKLLASFPLPDSAKERVAGKLDCWGYRVYFSADSQTLLLGTRGGLVHRWDIHTRQELPPLKKHFGMVIGMHTSPDRQAIVTTDANGLIHRWDWRTGRELSEVKGYVGRTHAAYSPDGRFAAVGDVRGRLDLWDARTGRLLHTLQSEGPAVTKLAFAPDGQSLATAQADNTVHFWAIPAGEEQRVLHCKEQSLAYLGVMRFSPDGRRLLIVDHNYSARLWDPATGEVGGRSGFGISAFSADGKTVVTESGPYLYFFDAANGKTRARVRLKTGTPDNRSIISAIEFSPDGQRLAVSLHGGDVCLWDAHTGAEAKHFLAADSPKGLRRELLRERVVRADGLTFSPDGRWLCTSGSDGSVRLWEVVTGREVLRLKGHEDDTSEVSFGADSRTVLSCGKDAQAYLWSLRPPMEKEAKSSLDALWAALAGKPAKAYRAIWALSEAKDAAAFLCGKLAPVKPVMEDHVKKLIADLESETFAVRESATKALAELGEVAAPAMRKTLANKSPLETRKRLEELIQRIEAKKMTTEELRTWRALDVLERIGTPEARQSLKTLADGAPGARLTEAAKAVLKRLRR